MARVTLHMVPVGVARQDDLDILQRITQFFQVGSNARQHLLRPCIEKNQSFWC